MPKSSGGRLTAPRLQAWNERIKDFLPQDVQPIARHIQIRSEFSGACTAELSAITAASLCKEDIAIDCLSCADWATSARTVAKLNHEKTCRFKDIMDMAPAELRGKLMEEVTEKAHFFPKDSTMIAQRL